MKKINRAYITVSLLILALFLVQSLSVWIRYLIRPEDYVFNSAPWYTPIEISAAIAGVAYALSTLAWLYLKHKYKDRP